MTIADAIALAEHTTIDQVDYAYRIYIHYIQNYSTENPAWDFTCSLNTVLCAGYIAGVRAERARRKGGKKFEDRI